MPYGLYNPETDRYYLDGEWLSASEIAQRDAFRLAGAGDPSAELPGTPATRVHASSVPVRRRRTFRMAKATLRSPDPVG